MAGQSGSSQNAHDSTAVPHLKHFLDVVTCALMPFLLLLQRESHPSAAATPRAKYRVPPHRSHTFATIAQPFVETSGGHILARNFTRSRLPGVGAFGWESGGHPVQLARDIVVHLAEPQLSSLIPAVDDHRSVAVEDLDCLSFEVSQREVYGPGR
jgi:hypothetical protein